MVNIFINFLDCEDYAFFNENKINICINNKHDVRTQFLMMYSMFTHEYTHLIRINLNKYSSPFPTPKTAYEYFLNPEEMISFYNQILVESIIRKCSFLKCLEYYINNYLKNKNCSENIIKRFYNGLYKLYILNKKGLMHMNASSYKSLEQYDIEMQSYEGSLARSAMGIPPEQRDVYIAEKRRQLMIMREEFIKTLEHYEQESENNKNNF
jgi:hypothetical protein